MRHQTAHRNNLQIAALVRGAQRKFCMVLFIARDQLYKPSPFKK
jgi:hypothetical protein